MNQLSEVAASLMEHCTADERVCPRGDKWQELWKMLPEDSTKAGREKMPPQPLILAAASCEPWEKRMRVKDHIAWADAQGVIEQVNSFLRDLPFEEWERSTSNCIKDGSYGSWLCSERDRAMIEDYVDNNDVEGMTIYLSEGGVAPDSASLCVAAGRGYNDMLDLLLDAGIVPDADAICSAAGTSNIQGIDRLLRAGAPIDLAIPGYYALHNATMENQTEIVDLLFRRGANSNVTMQDGTTPLMIAVRGGDISIVELLLKYGADPLCRNELGETALDQAKENNQQAAVTILESLVSK